MELEGRGGYKLSLALKGPDPCTLPPIQAARKAFVNSKKKQNKRNARIALPPVPQGDATVPSDRWP